MQTCSTPTACVTKSRRNLSRNLDGLMASEFIESNAPSVGKMKHCETWKSYDSDLTIRKRNWQTKN